jgi:hypothetical protein
MLSFAGSVLMGISAPYLDGDIWRSPAVGGGDTQGPDRFFSFCSRVFSVIFKVLSSNPWFLRASDVKGPRCKMYPPRMQLIFSGVFQTALLFKKKLSWISDYNKAIFVI